MPAWLQNVKPRMITIETVSIQRIGLRDPNVRVVLRSIHGSNTRIVVAMPGMMIAPTISRLPGTRLSKPKRSRKYQAGYGTNCDCVGSAFASRNGGAMNESPMMIRKITNDATVSMNI